MKVKDNFMIRQVADCYVVVPVGPAVSEFNGMINLNEVGAFFWRTMQADVTEDEIISAMISTYDVDEATARADVSRFIDSLKEADLLA